MAEIDDGGSDGGAQLREANAAAAAGGDWRARVPPETRSRIVTKITETLKKHLPVSELEGLGLSEIQKKAMQFEEMTYTAATSQSDYWQKIALQILSMENQTNIQQVPIYAQVIRTPGPASGFLAQGNPGQSSAISLVSQQASLPSPSQSLPGFSQTSTLKNMSGSDMPQNTRNNNGFAQGIYAARRQLAGRKEHEQQEAELKLIYQQQKIAMMQKLMMQRQQQQQQQSLLHQNHMLSTQQPWMQMSPGLQSEQSTTPQPIHQPNIHLQQQLRLQQLMQQSISQHGSVSGIVQQGSTLPKQEQLSRSLMCTTQPNNTNSMRSNAVSFEELRQKQEFFSRHHMHREMHRQLLEKQPTAQQKSQKQQPVPMQVTKHHFENDVMNKLKDTCMVASLLLFIGVLLVVWFMVCSGWGDLLQV